MATKKKASTKQVEIEDDEEIELEDLDEDVEEETSSKSKVPAVEFGAADLAAHLSELTGKTISTRDLRALVRKMAREEDPRVNREIKPGNRTRYDWPGGLKNPEVKAIIKAVTGGEMEADKKAKLEELKQRKAAKGASKGKKGKKASKVQEPEDDDIEEIEIDDDED